MTQERLHNQNVKGQILQGEIIKIPTGATICKNKLKDPNHNVENKLKVPNLNVENKLKDQNHNVENSLKDPNHNVENNLKDPNHNVEINILLKEATNPG